MSDLEEKTQANLVKKKNPKNAFDMLMTSKSSKDGPKVSKVSKHGNNTSIDMQASTKITGNPRDDLLFCILAPESTEGVIEYTEDWVIIKDKYPKGTVHLLLLPRNPKFYTKHPFISLSDMDCLDSAKRMANRAREIAVSELRRLHGKHSATEGIRIEAMESDDPPSVLPAGRGWDQYIKIGVHSHPSMNHMHIHIVSTDSHSPCIRKAVHYNSFKTKFFVPLEDFPLGDDDFRWNSVEMDEIVKGDLICWRCGKNYGRAFTRLKDHLDVEYREWRKE